MKQEKSNLILIHTRAFRRNPVPFFASFSIVSFFFFYFFFLLGINPKGFDVNSIGQRKTNSQQNFPLKKFLFSSFLTFADL